MKRLLILGLALLSGLVMADTIGLSWTHSDKLVDGGALNQEDITDYIVKYSYAGGEPIELSVGNGETADIEASAGVYIFRVATVTTVRGPFSEPISVIVETLPVVPPAAPTLLLEILCLPSGCTLQIKPT